MSLFDALLDRDVARARRLLDAGADANAQLDGLPALALAARLGDPDLVTHLLRVGADPDAVSRDRVSALVEAILANAPLVVRQLLSAGASPGAAHGDTPLCVAVLDGPDTVHELLNHGADPRERRSDGWNPLMLAAWRGDRRLVQLLLEHGADPTACVGDRLMDAATIAAVHGHTDCRDVLTTAGQLAGPPLEALWTRIGDWCEENAPELHAAFEQTVLESPTPESWTGLPADAAEQLVQWPSGLPFFGGMASLGGDRAYAHWERLCEETWPEDVPDLGDEPVRPVWWDPAWVPVARSGDVALMFVDRAPLATGVAGQLVHWERETGPRRVVASSLTAYLAHLFTLIKAGEITYSPTERALVYRR